MNNISIEPEDINTIAKFLNQIIDMGNKITNNEIGTIVGQQLK
jgi:hypothetical protein